MPNERHPPTSNPPSRPVNRGSAAPSAPYRPVDSLYSQPPPVSRNNPAAPVSRNNPAALRYNPAAPVSRDNPAAPRPRYDPAAPTSQSNPAAPRPRYDPAPLLSHADPRGNPSTTSAPHREPPIYATRVGDPIGTAPSSRQAAPFSQYAGSRPTDPSSQFPGSSRSSNEGIGGLQANNWRMHSRDLLELRPVGQLRKKAAAGSISNPLDLTSDSNNPISLYNAGQPYAADPYAFKPISRTNPAPRKQYGSEFGGAPLSEKDAAKGIQELLEGMNEVKVRRRKRGKQPKVDDLADMFRQSVKLDGENKAPTKEESEEEEEEEDEDADKVEGLDVTLLPHQVDGLAWLLSREEKKARGGILADDMGLGKTVQSIALILSHPHPKYAMTESAHIDEGIKIPEDMARTTLIVGPLALIKQWESELNTKTTSLPRALKVLVHHGPNRTKDSRVLSKYDVVVTTYPIVASEHKTTSEDKPSALYGVRWWRIILDEAHSIKNPSAKGSQACFALRGRFRWCLTGTPIQNNLEELQSLIRFLRIAPYDEMTVWKEQIVRPLKNGKEQLAMDRLKVILGAILLRRTKKVLGEREKKRIEAGEEKGRNEMMNLPPRNVKSVICKFTTHEKKFYDRLEDKTGRALDRLQGADKMDYTGALVLLLRLRQACNHPQLLKGKVSKDLEALASAKPSGNSRSNKEDIDDLADVLSGLTVEAKKCDICLETLTPSQIKTGEVQCDDCRVNLNSFTKKERGSKNDETERRDNRDVRNGRDWKDRDRKGRKKEVIVIEDSDPEPPAEEDYDSEAIPSRYKRLAQPSRRPKSEPDSDSEGLPSRYRKNADSDSEGIPSRYRKNADSDSEGIPNKYKKKSVVIPSDDDDSEDDFETAQTTLDSFIEDDGYEEIYKQRTKRRPKDERIDDEAEESSGEESEPFDPSDASGSEAEESEHDEDGNLIKKGAKYDESFDEEYASSSSLSEDFGDLIPSTKISQLLKILKHEKTQSNKTIVFSSFTSMLDLIEPFLRSAGYNYARYDGGMKNDLREAALHKLKTSPSCYVLLCSLKCGAVGLNLTAANRVVLLEPFWNPAIEDQAIDRVHRFGQKKDVLVYKFNIEESVEERVLELQEQKRRLIDAAIGDGNMAAGAGRLGMKEILALFKRDAELNHCTGSSIVGGTYHNPSRDAGVSRRYDAGAMASRNSSGRYGRY